MTAPLKHAIRAVASIALVLGVTWGVPAWAGAGQAQLHIGLTIVDPNEVQAPLPAPDELDFPASRNAVLCGGQGAGYRECRTPFRGPVTLSREIAPTRCVQGRNWGWREGLVWVDDGCAAVFMRAGA
jgi:hypothetical protein